MNMKKKLAMYDVQRRINRAASWESLMIFGEHWRAKMFLANQIKAHVSAAPLPEYRIIPIFQSVLDPPKSTLPKMWGNG